LGALDEGSTDLLPGAIRQKVELQFPVPLLGHLLGEVHGSWAGEAAMGEEDRSSPLDLSNPNFRIHGDSTESMDPACWTHQWNECRDGVSYLESEITKPGVTVSCRTGFWIALSACAEKHSLGFPGSCRCVCSPMSPHTCNRVHRRFQDELNTGLSSLSLQGVADLSSRVRLGEDLLEESLFFGLDSDRFKMLAYLLWTQCFECWSNEIVTGPKASSRVIRPEGGGQVAAGAST
jgi:hypothetical protein